MSCWLKSGLEKGVGGKVGFYKVQMRNEVKV
jgi:hypothetical protein